VKITPEERAILTRFAGFAAAALGLPELTGKRTMLYLVNRFIAVFDEHADVQRAEIAQLRAAVSRR